MAFDCPKTSLKQGSSGEKVKELQEELKKLGYYTGKVDGSFGPVTKSAVISFQKRYGLKQDGWFGEISCKKLQTVSTSGGSASGSDVFDCPNTSLKKGSKEKAKVTTLQTYLKEWGYYEKSVDGDFGTYTELAVKDFQNEVGESADGWFGPKTCKHFVARVKGDDEEEKNPYVIGSKINDTPLYARYLKGTLTMYPEVIVEEEEEVTVTTTSSSSSSSDSSSSSTDTGGSGAGSYNDMDSSSSSDDSSSESSTSSEPTTTTTKIKRYKIVEIGKGKNNTKEGGALDCSNISLKRGSTGDDVKTLQTGLQKMGYYTSTIDGDFGAKTEAAVKQLQAATGQTVDGWFGSKTCPEFNKKLGIDTSKVESKPSFTLTDLIDPNPNSDVDGLTHDCTLRTPYTQEKLSKIQVMQRCKLELQQDIAVVYKLDGYVNELKIVQENSVMLIELSLTGYSAFLEQDFADYSGNKKQSEHLKAICQEIGLLLKLELNGLKDENIELNKVVVSGSGGSTSSSSGGKTVQMSNNDCDSSDKYQSHHWANHRCKPPKCTAKSKEMHGNSNTQYARDTASHNGSSRELVEYVQSRCQYQLYADNPYGSSRCPDNMWKSSGKIRGNCADYARMLKCILDVNGYQSIICHIPGHFYNAIWENGGWTVCDLCRVLYGDSAYGHANHGNVKPTGTWDNPQG